MLRTQYEIPFMIWCSNSFKNNNEVIVNNIKAALKKTFMNDNVCQILMGLVGMKTIYYH
jgi:heptose-I-phosphate ethanolaminephosphotransferase